MKYPVAKPDIGHKEKQYLSDAINSGWISSKGPFVEKFENKFAEYIGTRYAVACSSGTAALTLAMSALGINKNDLVLVPDFTMIATAWGPKYLGAEVQVVDCDENLNMDPGGLPMIHDVHVRAMIPTHIYGRPCKMKAFMEIARERNIHVVEDCAEALGATIDGQKVGTFGIMGCFSLFANKIISAGEGGVVTTDDKFLYEELKKLRSMYFDPDHSFKHEKLAYNFRMTNMQAAVALGQLERIDEFLNKRQQIQSWYDGMVLEEYKRPRPKGSVLWMYDVVLPKEVDRDGVIRALASKGVEARRFFKPMHSQKHLDAEYDQGREYLSIEMSERGLYLPTYTELKKEEVEEIATIFNSVI